MEKLFLPRDPTAADKYQILENGDKPAQWLYPMRFDAHISKARPVRTNTM